MYFSPIYVIFTQQKTRSAIDYFIVMAYYQISKLHNRFIYFTNILSANDIKKIDAQV